MHKLTTPLYTLLRQQPSRLIKRLPIQHNTSLLLLKQQQPRWLSTITPTLQQHNANPPNDQDELETIDPKDYPELYPEQEAKNELDEEELVDTEWFVEEEQDENFVPLWQRRAIGDHLHGRWAMQEASKRLIEAGDLTPNNIQALLEENKMDHIQVLDVRGKCDWTDYMVIAESDKGDRFLSNVAEQIRQTVNKAIRENPTVQDELSAPHIEGRDDQSGWVLIDLGTCVVHLFTPEVRQHYDLEGLWLSNNKNNEQDAL